MVMIPVGNRTRHNFGIWCFAEAYIRIIIMTVVISFSQDILTINQNRFIGFLFSLWVLRPVYLNFKGLYSSWKWAKLENDAKSQKQEGEKDE